MKDIKQILLDHYHKYPLMQMEDFLKLLYQSHFGPRHMSSHPSLERVKGYLHQELKEMETQADRVTLEDIGGGYVRIYLESILNEQFSIDEVAELFYESMVECAEASIEHLGSFRQSVNLLIQLIIEKFIPFELKPSNDLIDSYFQEGIRPIHHSKIYNQNYNPHYRVVSLKRLQNKRVFL